MKQSPGKIRTKTILRMRREEKRRENRSSIKNVTIIFELNNKHNLLASAALNARSCTTLYCYKLRNFSEELCGHSDQVSFCLIKCSFCSEGNVFRRCPRCSEAAPCLPMAPFLLRLQL